MMMRLSALLLLLAVPSDARLEGTGRRSLQGFDPCVALEAYMETVWVEDTALLAAMQLACEEFKNKDDTFPCQSLPLPANTSPINCMETSGCPSTEDVCIFTSFPNGPGTYCMTPAIASSLGGSILEMCDENPVP